MFRLLTFLACLILIEGRPHDSHNKAHVIENKEASTKQSIPPPVTIDSIQNTDADNEGVTNVHNVQVTSTDGTEHVGGQVGPHSVAVTMTGPGHVFLSTTQQETGPEIPDHTLTVMKDTSSGGPGSYTLNLPSGHQTPPSQPSDASQPQPHPKTPKETKPKELQTETKKPAQPRLHSKPQVKVPHRAQKTTEKADMKQEESPKDGPPPPAHKLHHKAVPDKEHAHHEPENHHELHEGEDLVHSVHIDGTHENNDIYHQMDTNHVGVSMQGPGAVDLTTNQSESSHTIVFDPSPPERCPGEECPTGHGHHEEHH